MHSSPGVQLKYLQSNIPASHNGIHLTDSNLAPTSASPDSLPDDIHPGLRPLITTTTHPHEIYPDLQQSRERRLRSLLRRLVNQIQYGCRNTQCDVPTCLSYRKRESKGPVRQYNDVVARALAWECLEQYARNERDVFRPDERNTRNKTKKRQGGQHDPFCRNEPVVPWYQDPTEYLKRRKNDSEFSGKIASLKEVKTRKTSPTRTKPCLPQGLTKESSNGHVVSVVSKASNDLEPSNALELEADADNNTSRTEQPHAVPIKHDQASFTQFLFNQDSIHRLFKAPEQETIAVESNRSTGDKQDIEHEKNVIDSRNHPDQPFSEAHEIHVRGSTSGLNRVYTFKHLPASAILWLKLRLQGNKPKQPETSDDRDKKDLRYKQTKDLARQSLHFVLSHPLRLIESAEDWDFIGHSAGRPYDLPDRYLDLHHVDDIVSSVIRKERRNKHTSRTYLPSWDSIHSVCTAFQSMIVPDGSPLIADQLFAALQHCYIPPNHFSSGTTTATPVHASVGREFAYLDDSTVAHLLILTIGLINGLTYGGGTALDRYHSSDFSHFHVMHPNSFIVARGTLQVYPQHAIKQMYQHLSESMRVAICGEFLRNTYWSNDPAIDRLIETIADIISHRLALLTMENAKDHADHGANNGKKKNIVQTIVQTLSNPPVRDPEDIILVGDHYSLRLLLHMQHVLLTKWDRRPVIRRTGPVGGALKMLAEMYRLRQSLRFEASYFQMQMVAGALNEVDMPFEWLSFQKDAQKTHILEYAFIFDAATLVRYFRSINLKAMQQAHEHALAVYVNAKSHLIHTSIPVYGVKEILEKTRPHMARYFVMTISRQNVLEDAINQIWKRQRQELMRPLKVQVGKDDGEDGLDHGGVQQEFFRLVFAEALNPDFGMFVIDDTTRMTWFQPASMEPLYKFEALGVLLSLAVYNSITMPLTFPLAFYRKLLGLKVKTLDHIADGWPVLGQNLKTLLTWSDGDVGDVIMRTYEFSYEICDKVVTVDMKKAKWKNTWSLSASHKLERKDTKTTSSGLQTNLFVLNLKLLLVGFILVSIRLLYHYSRQKR